jgi:hypothetical protein
LAIGTSDMDGDALSRLTTLKQLEVIRLGSRQDVTPVLKIVRNSTSLKTIDIGKSKATVIGIGYLAASPRLEQVTFEQLIPDRPSSTSEALHLLSTGPVLCKVTIPNTALSLEDISTLASFRNLKELHIDRITPSNHETSNKALHILSKNPKLKVLGIRVFPMNEDSLKELRLLKNLGILDFETRGRTSVLQLQQLVALRPGLKLSLDPTSNWASIEVRHKPEHKAK